MKMVMIVYNEAVDMEVMEVMEHCGLKNYTKITAAYGKGTSSGTHLGNDIWPGRNNILYVACEEPGVKKILDCIRQLRKQLSHEGIKAFVYPIDEIT